MTFISLLPRPSLLCHHEPLPSLLICKKKNPTSPYDILLLLAINIAFSFSPSPSRLVYFPVAPLISICANRDVRLLSPTETPPLPVAFFLSIYKGLMAPARKSRSVNKRLSASNERKS